MKPEQSGWYRFDSFANLTHFDVLTPGGLNALIELAGDETVADIGTGDGDMAFLFESLGCTVTAMDWPGVNANQMAGIRLIKRELGSAIEIREVDLDDQFRLDGERYGLVLALGLLYHLKNPFYFLERLGWHSRYCVLSTVILPLGMKEPIARLTGDREFHDDPTNYWFFSEAGVERLLDRCGWHIRHRMNVTDRYFCLAESRTAKSAPVIRLLHGWHELENRAWRWTGREFGAVIENTEGATRFELRFRIPKARPVTVEAEVNGIRLGAKVYHEAGDHIYAAAIPPAKRQNKILIQLSGELESDGRELGVIVMLPARTIIDPECGMQLL
jgi:tRNA (mo5U34)-methyltransferase